MTKHHLKGLGLKLNDYRPSAAQTTAMTERFLCIEQKIATYSRVKGSVDDGFTLRMWCNPEP
jgi:hypothetical protein